jgi:hypothetical protein
METSLACLAADLVRMDSRSHMPHVGVAARVEADLVGFEMGRLDDTHADGLAKRAPAIFSRLLAA